MRFFLDLRLVRPLWIHVPKKYPRQRVAPYVHRPHQLTSDLVYSARIVLRKPPPSDSAARPHKTWQRSVLIAKRGPDSGMSRQPMRVVTQARGTSCRLRCLL